MRLLKIDILYPGARKWLSNISIRMPIALILVFGASSCSSEIPGINELRSLCEKDGGIKIYKKIRAEGFYDSTTICHHCWKDLILSSFSYMEFCDLDASRNYKSYVISAPGCYRLTKVLRSNNKCHVGIDNDLSQRKTDPFIKFKERYCIKVKGIPKPTSKYKYSSIGEEIWVNRKKGVLIDKWELMVHDTNNKILLAKDIVYSLIPGFAKTPMSKPRINCRTIANRNNSFPPYYGMEDERFLKSVLLQ